MKKTNIVLLSVVVLVAIVIVIAMLAIKPGETSDSSKQSLEIDDCGQGTAIFYADDELCWQKSTMPEKAENWDSANEYCENLVLGEKDDWRLPTVEELSGILEGEALGKEVLVNKDYFDNTQALPYWTSSVGDFQNSHRSVDFKTGYKGTSLDVTKNLGVRCVRKITILG